MIKKNDLILIGTVLLLGLVILLIFSLTKSEGSKVMITIDGKEYKTLDLNIDTTMKVEVGNGEWNTFEIKDGHVNMLDASCPDKLCVKHKDIHYNHETIVCLPNKVVLEIMNGEDSEIDMIAN